jgi:hypothetical protein
LLHDPAFYTLCIAVKITGKNYHASTMVEMGVSLNLPS